MPNEPTMSAFHSTLTRPRPSRSAHEHAVDEQCPDADQHGDVGRGVLVDDAQGPEQQRGNDRKRRLQHRPLARRDRTHLAAGQRAPGHHARGDGQRVDVRRVEDRRGDEHDRDGGVDARRIVAERGDDRGGQDGPVHRSGDLVGLVLCLAQGGMVDVVRPGGRLGPEVSGFLDGVDGVGGLQRVARRGRWRALVLVRAVWLFPHLSLASLSGLDHRRMTACSKSCTPACSWPCRS